MNIQYVQGEAFFRKKNELPKQYNYLTKDISTDVVIVGGGVSGAILGYYFSKKGIDCVLIEKSRIAHLSTSITTSLLQYELDNQAKELKKYLTDNEITRCYQLGQNALDEIDKFIKEFGNNCFYKKLDSLLYTAKESEIKDIEEEYKFRKEGKFSVKIIYEKDNPYSFNLKAGVLGIGGGAQLDPYLFTHSLLQVAEKNGLKIYENSEVVGINYNESEITAETKYSHKIKGKIIIVATGYNTALFSDRKFGKKYTTYNIVSEPVENLDAIIKNVIVRDCEEPYNYFRTTSDNRIIIGGEDTIFLPKINIDKADKKYEMLEKRAKQLFPKYKLHFNYKYCGAFATTNDNIGFLGKDPKNEKLWYSLGYGANGLLFAILGGMMLSELYSGRKSQDLDLFDVGRFD